MKIDDRTLEQLLRQLAASHHVDLAYMDGRGELWRRDGRVVFRLRSRPFVHSVEIVEQDLLLAHAADAAHLLSESFSRGMREMRGAIFRDLVLNDHDHPVDYIGDGDHDVLQARVEQLAIRLMTLVERIGK